MNEKWVYILNSAIQPFSIKLQEHKIASAEFLSMFHVVYNVQKIKARFEIPREAPLVILRKY